MNIAWMSLAAGVLGGALLFRFDRMAASVGSIFAALMSIALVGIGIVVFRGGETLSFGLATPLPFLSLSLRFDLLSALFLIVIGAVGFVAALYGHGYMRHYEGTYRLAPFYAFFNLFIGSMAFVVLANNALFFLFVWEIMSLASYFLVVFDHKDEENTRAGYFYFIVTHIATAFLVVAFLLLFRATGSIEFDAYRALSGSFTPVFSVAVLLLALLGFGTKAGVIPFHIWLPAAHPAAPSHVSALMSGVMIKLGIFMLIRFAFDIFGTTPLWFGIAVFILGAISSILGVLYALGEHDIKRLLAYHSIENIGIILLGIGGALIFRSVGNDTLALLALAAALFHTVNHATFKSLLFLSAGAVVGATGTRNIEKYGGIAARMPWSAAAFLVGAIAISGIVPFNGFVSEWMTFQSMIGGLGDLSALVLAVLVAGIASLIFTSGLAAACFVKAFGVTFLARPRTEEARNAREADSGMRIGMGILALAALLLGVFAAPVAKLFADIAERLSDFGNTPALRSTTYALALPDGGGTLMMPLVLAGILTGLLIAWLVPYLLGGARKVVVSRTWDCGFPPTPRMEITGSAFAQSIVTVFRAVLRPVRHDTLVHREGAKYFIERVGAESHLLDVYRHYIYDPFAYAIRWAAARAGKIQSGSINAYLLYIMLTLVALAYFAFFSRL